VKGASTDIECATYGRGQASVPETSSSVSTVADRVAIHLHMDKRITICK